MAEPDTLFTLPASGHGVFLLDDHELVRLGLRHLLVPTGITVLGESASARQAIRRIPALRPQLAILDDQLPDGRGAGVCRALRAADPSIRCLILVDTADEGALKTAVLSDAWGCLSKQDENREQLRLIRRALAGGLAFSNRFRQLLQQSGTFPQDLLPESKLLSLTRQETNAVIGLGKGMSNRQIAQDLNITEKSVKNLVASALAKLGMVGRTRAAVFLATSADRRHGPGYRYVRSSEMTARAASALENCIQDGAAPIDDAARAKAIGALAAALTDFRTVRNSGPRPAETTTTPGAFPAGRPSDALGRWPGICGGNTRDPRRPRHEIAAP
jgi:DNA-binding NarL/FixJ family response regulator